MQLSSTAHGDVQCVTLPVETLDAANTQAFKQAVGPLISAVRRLVIDLGNVRFVDSSGCGVLLWCLRRARENSGDLKLIGVNERVAELFRIIRLDRQMDSFETLADAAAAFDH